MKYNPDFRGSPEVQPPANKFGGWTDGKYEASQAILKELSDRAKLEDDLPVFCRTQAPAEPSKEIMERFSSFQESKGRGRDGRDWSLLDQFMLGKELIFLPQIIGSCVASNTGRPWTIRFLYQIGILGEGIEFLGKNEFGPDNFCFYMPFNYGAGRKRGNMRSGDGMWCELMQQSLLKDGVIACNTPKLLDITKSLGVNREKDYPEPQNERVYRDFGNWKYIEDLRPYADYTLEECPFVTTADQLWDLCEHCKLPFVCSGIAIHKVGDHKDGFAIHAQNQRDQWMHNMYCAGRWTASDGERFFRWGNDSWGPQHMYNIRFTEVDRWYKRKLLTSAAIGRIRGPVGAPPTI